MKEGITVLSLFDGISCGRVALERADISVDKYYSSEIDKNAMIISNLSYPDDTINRLGNIENWKEWNVDWSSIDLLIGGSPCQGFSRNGLQLNFDDHRSKLFFYYVDILEHIKKYNSNVKFLLENVDMKKEWLLVIDDLLKTKGVLINSKLLSAQSRRRIYWSNIEYSYPIDKGIYIKDILTDNDEDYVLTNGQSNIVEYHNSFVRIKQATKKGYIDAYRFDSVNLSFPTSKTRRGRVIKGKSPTLDCGSELYYVGSNLKLKRFNITEMERLQTLPDGYTSGVGYRNRIKAIGNGWTVDVISAILSGLNNKKYKK